MVINKPEDITIGSALTFHIFKRRQSLFWIASSSAKDL
jgi:hypothetical protein